MRNVLKREMTYGMYSGGGTQEVTRLKERTIYKREFYFISFYGIFTWIGRLRRDIYRERTRTQEYVNIKKW